MKKIKLTILIVFMIMLGNTNVVDAQCAQNGNIYSFTYNSKTYEIVKEAKTWVDAAACAVERGGYLVEINDQAEADEMYNQIINGANISSTYTSVQDGGGVAYVWIGATDRGTEGDWIWDGNNDGNGTMFWQGEGQFGISNGSIQNNAYVNWGDVGTDGVYGEPDNFVWINSNGQDAAAIGLAAWMMPGQEGQWNDIADDNEIFYIIEYDASQSASNEADIINYSFSEQTEAAIIDPMANTVAIEVAMGTDVSNITPTYTLSEGATTTQNTTDFSNPVTYVVLAEDGVTSKNWIVTVSVAQALSDQNDITAFSFAEQTGDATIDIENQEINIEVGCQADLSNLVPTIEVSNLAAINPQSGVAQDFSTPFTYTVTAENGTSQDWTINVSRIGAAVISSFPWSESFETSFPPVCWQNTTWAWSTFGSAYEGNEFAYTNTSGSELITPEIILPIEGNFEFSYWYRVEDSGFPQDFNVSLSTDGTNFGLTLHSLSGYVDSYYQQFVFDLSAYAGQSIWIKFQGLTGSGGMDYGFLLDQIAIVENTSQGEDIRNENLDVVLYPNPVNDFIMISSKEIKSSCKISIFSTVGKLVYEADQYLNEAIDISELEQGVYFLEIHTDDIQLRKSFIKQ